MLLTVFGFIIRVVLLFFPIVLLMIYIFKSKRLFLVLMAVILCVNSIFMLFANIHQNNIFYTDNLDLKTIDTFFSDIEYGEKKEINGQKFVYDKDDESFQIATIENVAYKKYHIGDSSKFVPTEIVKESSFLNGEPQFTVSNSGVSYYASKLTKKLDLSCLIYNSSVYHGCVVIKSENAYYYLEYTVELNNSQSNTAGVLEQIFYQQKFNKNVDIMELFVK